MPTRKTQTDKATTATEKQKSDMVSIPKNAVLDYFPFNNKLIYILDDGELPGGEKGAVVLMYKVVNSKGEFELRHLPAEELEAAKQRYVILRRIFKEGK